MVHIQWQFRVFKKGLQEVLIFALFGNGSVDGFAEVIEIVGNKVGQIRPFGVIPTLFHGVQFGRVRRQRLECKPRRMVFLKIRRRRTMHIPTVPHHDHVASIMAMQQIEQPDQAG